MSAVLGSVGSWINRGVEPDRIERALAPLLVDDPTEVDDRP